MGKRSRTLAREMSADLYDLLAKEAGETRRWHHLTPGLQESWEYYLEVVIREVRRRSGKGKA